MRSLAIALTLLLTLVLFAGPVAAREPSLFDALPQQEQAPPAAEPRVPTSSGLLGAWTLTSFTMDDWTITAADLAEWGIELRLVLQPNGVLYMELNDERVYATFTLHNNTLEIEGVPVPSSLSADRNTMILHFREAGGLPLTYIFARAPYNALLEPQQEAPPRPGEGIQVGLQINGVSYGIDTLLGSWTATGMTYEGYPATAEELESWGISLRFDFRANGVVLVEAYGLVDEMRYTVNGNRVQVSYTAYAYSYPMYELVLLDSRTMQLEEYVYVYTLTRDA